MKLFIRFFVSTVLAFSLFTACSSNKDENKKSEKAVTKVEKKEEASLPDGYPAELTLPKGVSPKRVSVGEGTILSSGSANEEQKYRSYEIDIMHAKNLGELVAHYRSLLTEENGWKGKWNINEENEGNGTFKKNNITVKIKSDPILFMFKAEVMQQ